MSEDQIVGISAQNNADTGCDGPCGREPPERKEVVACCAAKQPELEDPCCAAKQPELEDLLTKKFARELFAEFLGTGIIVGLGTGAVMADIFGGALVGLFQVAAVWIIAVTIAIATTGPISGAHLNPAISLAFAIHRPCNGFGWIKVLPYMVAQTCGAIFFSWTNLIMYGPLIVQFEKDNDIIRGEPESLLSARAFGEYYV